MTIFLFSFVVLFWFGCGLVSYSFVIGNFKKLVNWLPAPLGLAVFSFFAGPVSLLADCFLVLVSKDRTESFKNCSFKRYTKEERFEFFKKDYQILVDIGVADFTNFDKPSVVTKNFEEKYER